MRSSYPKLHSIKWKSGVNADNVELLHYEKKETVPLVDVLSSALNAGLTDVALVGKYPNGESYIASTIRDHQKAAYLLGYGQFLLMENE